jgi:uncharacterized protein YjbI with pentapeptide repeats
VVLQIKARELLERYAAGERKFTGYRITSGGDELRGDLTGINLIDASLAKVYMEGIIFINADLRGAALTDCCLDAADLTNADLRGCSLRGANFRSANLTGADLRDARFENTDFSGANLTDANLSGTTLDALFRYNANLTRTNLRGAKIREQLKETIWNEAILLDTIMPDGNVRTNTL